MGSDGNGRTAEVTDSLVTYAYSTFSNDPNGGGGFVPGDYLEITNTNLASFPDGNYAIFDRNSRRPRAEYNEWVKRNLMGASLKIYAGHAWQNIVIANKKAFEEHLRPCFRARQRGRPGMAFHSTQH